MNKYLKKLTSLLIVIIIFLQLISPIVFAKNWNSSKYLALGDSIAYGYGLSNRETRKLCSDCTK